MHIDLMHWRGLRDESLASLLARYDRDAPRSAEYLAWENMTPVCIEFGSPYFERLMRESMNYLKECKVKPYKLGKNV